MRRDEIRNDILVLLMKGLMYHSLVCVLYNLASEKTLQMDLRLLALYIPLFLFDVIRRKCGNFFSFILFHAAIGGVLLLFFTGLEERITVGGCTALMAAASMHIRLHRADMEEECPAVSSLALFLLSYFAAAQMNRTIVMQINYYEAFLFLILFLIYRNLASMTVFIGENKGMENLPAKEITGINRVLLSIFVLCLAAGMLLIPYLPMGSLFDAARELFRILIRGIIIFLIWIFTRDTPQTEFLGEGAEKAMPSMEAGKTSMLAQIFEKIFMTAVCAALAAGAVYLIARGLYELYQKFYEQNKAAADESEFIWENPVRKVRVKRKREQKEFFAGRNINQRIRHLYKKSMQKQFGRKTDIPASMTMTELEELIARKQKGAEKPEKMADAEQSKTGKLHTENALDCEKIKQRIMLYQKARYSQYECGKQELETMKRNV